MGELFNLSPLLICVHDAVNVFIGKLVHVLACSVILACITKPDIAVVAVSVFLQDYATHGNRRAMKAVCGQADYCINDVLIFNQITPDCFFLFASEQNAVRKQNRSPAVILQMIGNMFKKHQIGIGLWSKRAAT